MAKRHCSVCRKSGHDRRFHERNPEWRMTAGGVRYPLRNSTDYDPAKAKGDERVAQRARQVAKGGPAGRKAEQPKAQSRHETLMGEAQARGELVKLSNGRWAMGPYMAESKRSVYAAAMKGQTRETSAEKTNRKEAESQQRRELTSIADLAGEAEKKGIRIPNKLFQGLMRQRPEAIRELKARIAKA